MVEGSIELRVEKEPEARTCILRLDRQTNFS